MWKSRRAGICLPGAGICYNRIYRRAGTKTGKVGGRFDVRGLRERVHVYIPITCLRGITWCAMAWIEYQNPEKAIFNESTFRKLEAYLDDQFLDNINEIIK